MKHSHLRSSGPRGSALITVLVLMFMMALLTASMLTYTISERRGNERNRLILRAKAASENITIYAAEQLTTKLQRLGSTPVMPFPWTGTTKNRVYLPPDQVLDTAFTSHTTAEMRAGIMAASGLVLDNDVTSVNYGLQVNTARVPIIAKITATHPALGSFTSYVEQDMAVALTPLFQFGMFYNLDLELYPSQNFTLAGPVHTNGRLLVHPDSSTQITIAFTDRVTCAGALYADPAIKTTTRGGDGSQTTIVSANGVITFTHTNGNVTTLKNNTSMTAGAWRDHKYTTTLETTTTIANFKTFATNTYNGNLRTSAHGVTKLELPGIGTYKEVDDPGTVGDDRSNGRQVIEPPNSKVWVWSTSTHTGAWTANTDSSDTVVSKISWRTGLNIMVNPSSSIRSGYTPDGTLRYVLPYSYRAFLNTINTTTFAHTVNEVILPGQPTYGYNNGPDNTPGTNDDYMYRNYLPNRYTTNTAVGSNQILRIPQSGFNTAVTYQTNGALVATNTTINLDTGTGPILAGETISFAGGTYKYLVISPLTSAGVITIASPGLLAAVADNTAVTVNVPYYTGSAVATGYTLYNAHLINATTINLRGSTGLILPGQTITITSGGVAYKYLVTAASTTAPANTSTTYTINIAPPGLRVAGANSDSAAIDTASGSRGTGQDYLASAATAAGATSLSLGTGTGTILPGNVLAIKETDGVIRTYQVANTAAGGTSPVNVVPALVAGVASGDAIFLDPFEDSGYLRTNNNGFSTTTNAYSYYPADSAAGPYQADAYFYDMRRANSNRGVISLSGTTALYDRFTVPYNPRPIAKIDFDVTRFKMMFNRVVSATSTSTVYDPRAPNVGGTMNFTHSIFNNGATAPTPVAFNLGIGSGFTTFPSTGTIATQTLQDPFQLYYAPSNPVDPLIFTNPFANFVVPVGDITSASTDCAWYDGVAIYVHSMDAEIRHQTSSVPDRIDSGVRLVNGRGPVPSLSTAGKTGFTFVTNDAVYIIGHFNADGTINSTTTSTGNGGFSARWPDSSSEYLAAVMGDAFTALSSPTWTSTSSGQVNGWNDALSALAASSPTSGWRTGASTTAAITGTQDGLYITTGIYPGLLPTDSTPNTSLGSAQTTKLAAMTTEMSTALLMGIVPTNHSAGYVAASGSTPESPALTDGFVPTWSHTACGDPAVVGNRVNAGGANNFPRLSENWSGQSLYIRGSIVALYESRVAMEPFTNSRCYSAPGRYWGLHQNFRTAGHDLPLEPIVLGNNRVGFRELSASDYATMKTTIEGLH